jgi:hypothetical protein
MDSKCIGLEPFDSGYISVSVSFSVGAINGGKFLDLPTIGCSRNTWCEQEKCAALSVYTISKLGWLFG